MVRIPSLRRPETAPTQDENHDGRIDERDARLAEARATGRAPETRAPETRATGTRATDARATDAGAVDRPRPVDRTDDTAAMDRTQTIDRPVTDRPVTGEPATGRSKVAPADRTEPVDRTEPLHTEEAARGPIPVAPGPRPRASLLATLSLIVGVAAALFVLSGTLAMYGVGLGVLALLLAVGGISATGRRHIAGKSDALIGLALGLGAVIVGILAVTGDLAWPNTDVDTVQRFREWLDAQFVGRVSFVDRI